MELTDRESGRGGPLAVDGQGVIIYYLPYTIRCRKLLKEYIQGLEEFNHHFTTLHTFVDYAENMNFM